METRQTVYPLCKISELPESSSRGFSIGEYPESIELLLVHSVGRVRAYRNSCPHTGVPLEWLPDRFLDDRGKHIQCSTHGALFQIEDGYCVSGPCAGRSLESLSIRIEDQQIVLLTEN